MNRSLFKNLWVGPDWRKKLLKERSGSYFGYKQNHDFSEVPFQCIFNDFSFLLDISMKITLHVWFYLSSLQYFISHERLVTWSRAFCSLWVHLVFKCDVWFSYHMYNKKTHLLFSKWFVYAIKLYSHILWEMLPMTLQIPQKDVVIVQNYKTVSVKTYPFNMLYIVNLMEIYFNKIIKEAV